MIIEHEPYISLREAAEYMRIEEQDLRRKSRLGQVPCYIVGGGAERNRYRYRKSELDAWMKTSRKIGPRSSPPEKLARVV